MSSVDAFDASLPPVPAEPVPLPPQFATGQSAPVGDGKGMGDGKGKKEKKGKPQGQGQGKGGKSKGKGKTPWRPFDGPTGSGQGYRLNVKNLSSQMASAEALKALFAPFGKVSGAEVKLREDGSSRGFGFVILGSEAEGQQAMAAMNGKVVGGKALKVAPAQRREEEGEDGKGGGPGVALPGLGADSQAAMMQMQMAQAQLQLQQAAYMQALLSNPLANHGLNPAMAGLNPASLGLGANGLGPAGLGPVGLGPAGLGAFPGANHPFLGLNPLAGLGPDAASSLINPALNPYASFGLPAGLPPMPCDLAAFGSADGGLDAASASR